MKTTKAKLIEERDDLRRKLELTERELAKVHNEAIALADQKLALQDQLNEANDAKEDLGRRILGLEFDLGNALKKVGFLDRTLRSAERPLRATLRHNGLELEIEAQNDAAGNIGRAMIGDAMNTIASMRTITVGDVSTTSIDPDMLAKAVGKEPA